MVLVMKQVRQQRIEEVYYGTNNFKVGPYVKVKAQTSEEGKGLD